MRIGILTQPLRANYGGLIQNYALQQVLKQLGHEPITIDQKEKEFPKWYRFLGFVKSWILYIINSSAANKPKYSVTRHEDNIIRKYCISFIEKNLSVSNQCAGTEEFRKEAKRLGIEGYVVGSDQCWRPMYNIYLSDMFLNFTLDMEVKKRVAYAASFGSDNWEFSDQMTIICADLAKMFDSITVRESSGIKLCKQYLGVDAVHVLDPTLLLKREEYIALIEANNIPISNGKLFNYVLDPSETMSRFIDRVSKETGYKIFQVLPKYNEDHRSKYDIKNRIEDCVYPSPLTWLRAFMDADMVIADSFHGTVFSIIFNKPFWVLGNVERGMSRFSSLLSMFGLEERLITVNQLDNIDYNSKIDWDRVNNILEKKRLESLNILKSSLC